MWPHRSYILSWTIAFSCLTSLKTHLFFQLTWFSDKRHRDIMSSVVLNPVPCGSVSLLRMNPSWFSSLTHLIHVRHHSGTQVMIRLSSRFFPFSSLSFFLLLHFDWSLLYLLPSTHHSLWKVAVAPAPVKCILQTKIWNLPRPLSGLFTCCHIHSSLHCSPLTYLTVLCSHSCTVYGLLWLLASFLKFIFGTL